MTRQCPQQPPYRGRTENAVRVMRLFSVACLGVIVGGGGEWVARQTLDPILYSRDSDIGYRVRPDQRGGSIVGGSFAINDKGMGVAEAFDPREDREDVLLVGDSLVFGPKRLEQAERLGPALERLSGWQVWPLSARSWSLWNGLRAIGRTPGLERVDTVVFVVSEGDFDRPSQWSNAFDHPTSRPSSYLLLGLRKLLRGPESGEPQAAVRQSDLSADWASFVASSRAKEFVIGYDGPATPERDCGWLPGWLKEQSRFHCFDAIANGGGSDSIDGFHPNAAGNEALARFIARRIGRGEADADPSAAAR